MGEIVDFPVNQRLYSERGEEQFREVFLRVQGELKAAQEARRAVRIACGLAVVDGKEAAPKGRLT